MKTLKQILAKGAFGTVAAGAMALATANPAMAVERYDQDHGLDAGEVIAGAVITGGMAVGADAFDNVSHYDRRDRRYRDRRYDDRRYGGRDYDDRYYDNRGYRGGYHRVNERDAVDSCIYATEREAAHYFRSRRASVTEISRVNRTRYGVQVQGRIDIPGFGYRRGRGYQETTFSCYVDREMNPAVNVAGRRLAG